MDNPIKIQELGRAVIESEIASLKKMAKNIGSDFVTAVEMLQNMKGRVVVTGIGKSALIAQKIAATFNSTGTPALFMHAADAVHGDLGMIQKEDIVLVLSKSGETPEIKVLVPFIKNMGNKTIALCGHPQSFLASYSDAFLNIEVNHEADPNDLAPTNSTTAQLVLGDALAMTLMQLKGFSSKDFARVHPGGALGKRLYLKVKDFSSRNPKPWVDTSAGLKKIILEISGNRLGAVVVLKDQKIVGIITDGDLRRMLERDHDLQTLKAGDICTPSPKTISADELAVSALEIMRKNSITQLVVVQGGQYVGIVHLHDLIKEGLL